MFNRIFGEITESFNLDDRFFLKLIQKLAERNGLSDLILIADFVLLQDLNVTT
jgi:hypothetical protein